MTLVKFPVPSTSLDPDTQWHQEGPGGVLTFTWGQGDVVHSGSITFPRIRGVLFKSDSLCSVRELEAYDTLVEIQGSSWRQEAVKLIAKKGYADEGLRHFMTYIDSVGCYEWLATEWAASWS